MYLLIKAGASPCRGGRLFSALDDMPDFRAWPGRVPAVSAVKIGCLFKHAPGSPSGLLAAVSKLTDGAFFAPGEDMAQRINPARRFDSGAARAPFRALRPSSGAPHPSGRAVRPFRCEKCGQHSDRRGWNRLSEVHGTLSVWRS